VRIELSGLVVGPGDTLVLAFKDPLSDEAYRRLKRRLDEALPGVEHVVVLENSAGMAAYRPTLATGGIVNVDKALRINEG
jgi:hypothetical protein